MLHLKVAKYCRRSRSITEVINDHSAAATNFHALELVQQTIALFDPGFPIGVVTASAVATAAMHVWRRRATDRLSGHGRHEHKSEHDSFHCDGLQKCDGEINQRESPADR